MKAKEGKRPGFKAKGGVEAVPKTSKKKDVSKATPPKGGAEAGPKANEQEEMFAVEEERIAKTSELFTGVPNAGSTCYAAAALQFLRVLEGRPILDVTKDSLKDWIALVGQQFMAGIEHDCSEFLVSYFTGSKFDMKRAPMVCKVTTCKNGHASQMIEPAWPFYVTMHSLMLTDDWKAVSDVADTWTCESCKALGGSQAYDFKMPDAAIASDVPTTTPDFVWFHLNRFLVDKESVKKNYQLCNYPESIQVCGSSYQWVCSVRHFGKELSSGHYDCVVRDHQGVWRCNDGLVKETGGVFTPSGCDYLLLYKRQGAGTACAPCEFRAAVKEYTAMDELDLEAGKCLRRKPKEYGYHVVQGKKGFPEYLQSFAPLSPKVEDGEEEPIHEDVLAHHKKFETSVKFYYDSKISTKENCKHVDGGLPHKVFHDALATFMKGNNLDLASTVQPNIKTVAQYLQKCGSAMFPLDDETRSLFASLEESLHRWRSDTQRASRNVSIPESTVAIRPSGNPLGLTDAIERLRILKLQLTDATTDEMFELRGEGATETMWKVHINSLPEDNRENFSKEYRVPVGGGASEKWTFELKYKKPPKEFSIKSETKKKK